MSFFSSRTFLNGMKRLRKASTASSAVLIENTIVTDKYSSIGQPAKSSGFKAPEHLVE